MRDRKNLKSLSWLFISILSLLFFFIAIPQPVMAATQPGAALTTSPVSVDLSANPGTSTSTNLLVENNSTKPVGITMRLAEFKPSGVSGEAILYRPSSSDPSESWVHFSQNSFVAQPAVWNTVTMTINVPKTAAFGYYYAVEFVPNIVPGVPVVDTIKGANAVLVLLDAHTPGEKPELTVNSFSTDKSSYSYLPATIDINIHNGGNIYTVPQGDVFISRTENGPNIDTLDFNSGQGNILPNSDRVFSVTWGDGFPLYQEKRINGQVVSDKNGKPVMQLVWNWNNVTKFRFGKYYAHLVLVYNNGTREVPIDATVSFWVIPWLMLIIIILFAALICLGIVSIFRFIFKKFRRERRKI